MPRVEAKGKRGKAPAKTTRARKPAASGRTSRAKTPPAESGGGGGGRIGASVALDAAILFALAGALFTGVAVYYPSLDWSAGNYCRDVLTKLIGIGRFLIPVLLLLIPFFAWPSRLRRTWLKAWGWTWCLVLLLSLFGGLETTTYHAWGGILGDSAATVGYHYLGWFYPVLLVILALIVLARLSGRSFIQLLGFGAWRVAVKTGAAVVDYTKQVKEEAAELTEERQQRRAVNREKRAKRDAEHRQRREEVLAAELEAADAPEGDSPVIRAGQAPVVQERRAPASADLVPSAFHREKATESEPAAPDVMRGELAEAGTGGVGEPTPAVESTEANGLELIEPEPSVADDDFARVVEAAGRVPLDRGTPVGGVRADAPGGEPGDDDYYVDSDGQLVLFESTQRGYDCPPVSLLRTAPVAIGEEQHLEKRARVIEQTLANFKIEAACVNSVVGPRVTRYELKIGPGINVSKIHGLADNLALELAVKAVRIEAPIPGKSAVGIEVPNAAPQLVTLRNILESPLNQQANHPLTVGLGRDIAGNPVVANLAKMPHLLVAGATGSGKSVCLNSLIISLLLRNSPDTLRLILIDPKRVEMTNYQDVPHLACPVVHDVNEAQSALKWVVAEMDRRYRVLERARARNIGAYNTQARPADQLPYIIVIIDELADLMMLAGQVIEKLICRIAQLSRAVGIHLVIATQRPDVKVITGTIKANVPSRIAFAVVSHIDSRTILDGSGADKLLGSGDMLFAPIGENVPLRVQGAFVADDEIDAVVEWCRGQAEAVYDESITQFDLEDDQSAGGADGGDRDELFQQAKGIVRDTGRASTSFLQRRLKIGYNRAARIMEELEMAGIVSEPDHTGNRKVL